MAFKFACALAALTFTLSSGLNTVPKVAPLPTVDVAALNQEVAKLGSRGPHHIAFRKFKKIVKAGGQPDAGAFEGVLRACKRAPSGPFTAKVVGFLGDMPPEDATSGFYSLDGDGSDLNPLTPLYALAFEACAADASPLDAMRVLEVMRNQNVPRTLGCYTDVLRAAMRGSELDRDVVAQVAGTVMRLLKADGMEPDGACYSVLVQVLLKAGRPDAALASFESMGDEDRATMPPSNWGRAVLAAARSRNAEKVHEILEAAWSRGISVSEPDMRAGLRCIGQEGDGYFRSEVVNVRHWRVATKILETLEEPTADDYHFAITACGRAGKGETALKLMQELRERLASQGVDVLPRKTYNSCLHATLREKMQGECQKLLIEMEKKKIGFDTVTYNIMLDQYAEAGDWRGAIRTLMQMDEVEEVSPTVVTFGTVIAAAARGQASFVASEILTRMRERYDIQPNTPCFVAALEACCRDPVPEDAAETAQTISTIMAEVGLDDERRELIGQLTREALRRDLSVVDSEAMSAAEGALGIALLGAGELNPGMTAEI